jgi:type I restriction enzyme S subunit
MTSYRQGVVYGQWRIHESDFLKIEEWIPSTTEQTKIANFLSAIDDKINHTQKQVEKAEVWKKGLMQQMFC